MHSALVLTKYSKKKKKQKKKTKLMVTKRERGMRDKLGVQGKIFTLLYVN